MMTMICTLIKKPRVHNQAASGVLQELVDQTCWHKVSSNHKGPRNTNHNTPLCKRTTLQIFYYMHQSFFSSFTGQHDPDVRQSLEYLISPSHHLVCKPVTHEASRIRSVTWTTVRKSKLLAVKIPLVTLTLLAEISMKEKLCEHFMCTRNTQKTTRPYLVLVYTSLYADF